MLYNAKGLRTPNHHTRMWTLNIIWALNCSHKFRSTQLYRIYLYALALKFSFTRKGPK